MGAIFSSIDIQTRMELKDLLSRFCHAIDYNRSDEWADLFLLDARVEAPRFGTFVGREQIRSIPRHVAEEGKGTWRHMFNNILIDRTEEFRTYRIQAYCTVNDWRKNGVAVRFWDFSSVVEKKSRWQFRKLSMCPVGEFCQHPRSYLDTEPCAHSEAIASEVADASRAEFGILDAGDINAVQKVDVGRS